MHPVKTKFQETLVRWDLVRPGESLLVAVSGGIDSMVLLHLLTHLPRRWRLRPTALHYNHRLRGTESDRDERFVRDYCDRQQIPCAIGHAPPWRSHANLQERARLQRYRFFGREAARKGFRKLLTAHQADDQAETFLIRWIQGAGLRGLSGIPMRRQEGEMEVIRPLLLIGRKEIREYAKVCDLPYREDSSNRSSRYLRNRIRRLLKGLRQLNPQLPGRSSLNALFLQGDEDYLQQTVERLARRLRSGGFPIRYYLRLHPALRFRLLQNLFGAPLAGEQILKLDQILRSPEGKADYHLSGGMIFRKRNGLFVMRKGR